MWSIMMNGSRYWYAMPAIVRRTGKPSPSKPAGAVDTASTGRSTSPSDAPLTRGRVTVSAVTAAMSVSSALVEGSTSVTSVLSAVIPWVRPCPGRDGAAEPNLRGAFHQRGVYGQAHTIRHLDPAVRRRRNVRPRRAARLPDPGRRPRLRQRVDRRAVDRHDPPPQPDRDADVRRRLHRAAAARLRGVRQYAAQPGAPGEEPQHPGPAQPRPARGGDHHRRPVPAVRRVRCRAGQLRRAVHRGAAGDEGAVDRGPGRPGRPVLATVQCGDGAQAVPEATPADLVRR